MIVPSMNHQVYPLRKKSKEAQLSSIKIIETSQEPDLNI